MSSDDQLVAAARQILDNFAKKPAAERFDYWVRLGMVDKEGQLTKLYGGTADAETGSLDEAEAILSEPLDRLIWVLRSCDSICLDAPTARRLTGGTSLEELVKLISGAVELGLVKRWNRDAGPLRPLDPATDKDWEVGTRLTEQGKARANKLEASRDASLPLEALTR